MERERDPKARHAAGRRVTDPRRDRRDRLDRKAQHIVEGRIRVDQFLPVPNSAQEIGQHQLDGSAPDLQPEKECTIRVQRQRGRGLADATPLRIPAQDQSILFQRAYQPRYGLSGEPGHSRDIRPRKTRGPTQQRQHQPLIPFPYAGLRSPLIQGHEQPCIDLWRRVFVHRLDAARPHFLAAINNSLEVIY
jgi:hypothetical protein